MILAVAGQKGGTGKTTLCICLAPLVDDVFVVDTDIQASFTNWASHRAKLYPCKQIRHINKANISDKIDTDLGTYISAMSRNHANIIVDCAGKDGDEFRRTLLACDAVIFPMTPGQLDMWTVTHLSNIVKKVLVFKPNLRAYFLLNKKDTNPKIKESIQATELLSNVENIKLLNNSMYERISYRRAPQEGLSVTELNNNDMKAKNEILNLYLEVYNAY